MRIVHELGWPCQVSGTGHPYIPGKSQPGPSRSFRAEVMICTAPHDHMPIIPSEVIYIEGDGLCMLRALQQAVDSVRASGQFLVEDGKLAPDWADFNARYELKEGVWQVKK